MTQNSLISSDIEPGGQVRTEETEEEELTEPVKVWTELEAIAQEVEKEESIEPAGLCSLCNFKCFKNTSIAQYGGVDMENIFVDRPKDEELVKAITGEERKEESDDFTLTYIHVKRTRWSLCCLNCQKDMSEEQEHVKEGILRRAKVNLEAVTGEVEKELLNDPTVMNMHTKHTLGSVCILNCQKGVAQNTMEDVEKPNSHKKRDQEWVREANTETQSVDQNKQSNFYNELMARNRVLDENLAGEVGLTTIKEEEENNELSVPLRVWTELETITQEVEKEELVEPMGLWSLCTLNCQKGLAQDSGDVMEYKEKPSSHEEATGQVNETIFNEPQPAKQTKQLYCYDNLMAQNDLINFDVKPGRQVTLLAITQEAEREELTKPTRVWADLEAIAQELDNEEWIDPLTLWSLCSLDCRKDATQDCEDIKEHVEERNCHKDAVWQAREANMNVDPRVKNKQPTGEPQVYKKLSKLSNYYAKPKAYNREQIFIVVPGGRVILATTKQEVDLEMSEPLRIWAEYKAIAEEVEKEELIKPIGLWRQCNLNCQKLKNKIIKFCKKFFKR